MRVPDDLDHIFSTEFVALPVGNIIVDALEVCLPPSLELANIDFIDVVYLVLVVESTEVLVRAHDFFSLVGCVSKDH